MYLHTFVQVLGDAGLPGQHADFHPSGAGNCCENCCSCHLQRCSTHYGPVLCTHCHQVSVIYANVCVVIKIWSYTLIAPDLCTRKFLEAET